jgi:ABC-2 type transport system ATP-binding protein
MPGAIEVEGLTKRFGSLLAVDDVAFHVPPGALYGFLGPNGSGKTTTLGMLTGLVPPDGGTARILGHDVRTDLPRALSGVGALIEEPAFYPYISGRENLRIVARLRGLADVDGAADAALARAGLAQAASAKYKGYSLGMRRRLGVAAALLGDPPVLLLDEPTNGLDPAGQRDVRALLRELAARGRTILVSSHLLHEVQEVCTHVAVLHKGRVLQAGPLADILRGRGSILVAVDDPERASAVLRTLDGVDGVRVEGGRLRVDAAPELAPRVNRALVEAGLAVSELTHARPALEERFLEMTQEARA